MVGGGIVGVAVARELALRAPGAEVVVLEREHEIARHQSSHNSGVIHAGVYYEPGSLKARLCVEGSRELIGFCRERGIAVEENGKLIIAADEHELPRLDALEERARANGVRDLERIDERGDIVAIEPAASGAAALHSPHTAVTDFAAVARSFRAELEAAGGRVEPGSEVVEAVESAAGVSLALRSGRRLEARRLVVCAGAFGEPIARSLGLAGDLRLVPFRGAYLELRTEHAALVRGNVYPVPDPALPFLGAHLTKGIDGRILLGPTALLATAPDAYRVTRVDPASVASTLRWPGTARLALTQRRAAARELSQALAPALLVRAARRLIPALRRAQFVPGPAGVRGQALGRGGELVDDFATERSEHALVVRNAPSPAATSSLALARLIADELGPLA
ncbi:L-2-hydroxyglutarate oxidase [Thermoleophilia bacterium SCSIO 60948]|nr:L-2-hydroxyglutarate oxidase [Thermoleophilia bacterium SCSIO 60948]